MADAQPLAGMSLGFVGLGHMGRHMARNLYAAGAELAIANRSQEIVRELAAAGMAAKLCPADVAAVSDITIICVTNTDALDAVLHGPDGIVAGVSAGKLIIDMGSSKVRETRAWADAIIALGGDYIDAPVSGGAVGAEAGTLSIMAGANPDALARARPVFDVLGKNITHVGEIGAGQVAKIANQSIVALTIAAVSEGLALAEHAGVDAGKVRQAMMGGFADSRILDLHGGRMVADDYPDAAPLTIQLKDVEQALELAEQSGFDMPSLQLNKSLWEEMIARGWADFDHAALIKLYRNQKT